MVCGLLLALSDITRFAVRVPVAVGAKSILMVQASPGGTELEPKIIGLPKVRRVRAIAKNVVDGQRRGLAVK